MTIKHIGYGIIDNDGDMLDEFYCGIESATAEVMRLNGDKARAREKLLAPYKVVRVLMDDEIA